MTCQTKFLTVPWLALLPLLTGPVVVQAQLSYTTNADNTLTVAGYAGPPWIVTIPATNNGLAVTGIGPVAFAEESSLTSVTINASITNIGDEAFYDCISLTGITIPVTVTSIGESVFSYCDLTAITIPGNVTNLGAYAFFDCGSLTAITVVASNAAYSSAGGVLFNKAQTTLIQVPGGLSGSYTIPGTVTNIAGEAFAVCTGLTNVTIPNSVTGIGESAFYYCTNLTRVTIPNSVTNLGYEAFEECFALTNVTVGKGITSIGDGAFVDCPGLIGVYFLGNAPGVYPDVFDDDNLATTYYLPRSKGWSFTFWNYPLGPPAVLWNPQAQAFGVVSNQFGFNIIGSNNLVVVVEACTNLSNPVWQPLQTNTLTNGLFHFRDLQWTNYPMRFYGFGLP